MRIYLIVHHYISFIRTVLTITLSLLHIHVSVSPIVDAYRRVAVHVASSNHDDKMDDQKDTNDISYNASIIVASSQGGSGDESSSSSEFRPFFLATVHRSGEWI